MANLNGLKKYHFIYKTTNLLNGKFYVGMHSTNKLNDGYLGSGKRLRLSIKKYGKENFKIEYLEFFDSRELLVEREKQLVNEYLLKDTNCMNLMCGGKGGFISVEQQRWRAICGNKKHNFLLKTDIDYYNRYSSKISNTFKQKHKNGIYKNAVSKLKKYWVGKSHTEETKQKMSEIKKGTGVGKTNSQFGTMWITNGTENKKIKKEEQIPTGWKAGRMLNIL
jgi:hypothetical protein